MKTIYKNAKIIYCNSFTRINSRIKLITIAIVFSMILSVVITPPIKTKAETQLTKSDIESVANILLTVEPFKYNQNYATSQVPEFKITPIKKNDSGEYLRFGDLIKEGAINSDRKYYIGNSLDEGQVVLDFSNRMFVAYFFTVLRRYNRNSRGDSTRPGLVDTTGIENVDDMFVCVDNYGNIVTNEKEVVIPFYMNPLYIKGGKFLYNPFDKVWGMYPGFKNTGEFRNSSDAVDNFWIVRSNNKLYVNMMTGFSSVASIALKSSEAMLPDLSTSTWLGTMFSTIGMRPLSLDTSNIYDVIYVNDQNNISIFDEYSYKNSDKKKVLALRGISDISYSNFVSIIKDAVDLDKLSKVYNLVENSPIVSSQPTNFGDSKATADYNEDLLAKNLLEKIKSMVDYGFWPVIEATIAGMVNNVFYNLFINAGENALFFTPTFGRTIMYMVSRFIISIALFLLILSSIIQLFYVLIGKRTIKDYFKMQAILLICLFAPIYVVPTLVDALLNKPVVNMMSKNIIQASIAQSLENQNNAAEIERLRQYLGESYQPQTAPIMIYDVDSEIDIEDAEMISVDDYIAIRKNASDTNLYKWCHDAIISPKLNNNIKNLSEIFNDDLFYVDDINGSWDYFGLEEYLKTNRWFVENSPRFDFKNISNMDSTEADRRIRGAAYTITDNIKTRLVDEIYPLLITIGRDESTHDILNDYSALIMMMEINKYFGYYPQQLELSTFSPDLAMKSLIVPKDIIARGQSVNICYYITWKSGLIGLLVFGILILELWIYIVLKFIVFMLISVVAVGSFIYSYYIKRDMSNKAGLAVAVMLGAAIGVHWGLVLIWSAGVEAVNSTVKSVIGLPIELVILLVLVIYLALTGYFILYRMIVISVKNIKNLGGEFYASALNRMSRNVGKALGGLDRQLRRKRLSALSDRLRLEELSESLMEKANEFEQMENKYDNQIARTLGRYGVNLAGSDADLKSILSEEEEKKSTTKVKAKENITQLRESGLLSQAEQPRVSNIMDSMITNEKLEQDLVNIVKDKEASISNERGVVDYENMEIATKVNVDNAIRDKFIEFAKDRYRVEETDDGELIIYATTADTEKLIDEFSSRVAAAKFNPELIRMNSVKAVPEVLTEADISTILLADLVETDVEKLKSRLVDRFIEGEDYSIKDGKIYALSDKFSNYMTKLENEGLIQNVRTSKLLKMSEDQYNLIKEDLEDVIDASIVKTEHGYVAETTMDNKELVEYAQDVYKAKILPRFNTIHSINAGRSYRILLDRIEEIGLKEGVDYVKSDENRTVYFSRRSRAKVNRIARDLDLDIEDTYVLDHENKEQLLEYLDLTGFKYKETPFGVVVDNRNVDEVKGAIETVVDMNRGGAHVASLEEKAIKYYGDDIIRGLRELGFEDSELEIDKRNRIIKIKDEHMTNDRFIEIVKTLNEQYSYRVVEGDINAIGKALDRLNKGSDYIVENGMVYAISARAKEAVDKHNATRLVGNIEDAVDVLDDTKYSITVLEGLSYRDVYKGPKKDMTNRVVINTGGDVIFNKAFMEAVKQNKTDLTQKYGLSDKDIIERDGSIELLIKDPVIASQVESDLKSGDIGGARNPFVMRVNGWKKPYYIIKYFDTATNTIKTNVKYDELSSDLEERIMGDYNLKYYRDQNGNYYLMDILTGSYRKVDKSEIDFSKAVDVTFDRLDINKNKQFLTELVETSKKIAKPDLTKIEDLLNIKEAFTRNVKLARIDKAKEILQRFKNEYVDYLSESEVEKIDEMISIDDTKEFESVAKSFNVDNIIEKIMDESDYTKDVAQINEIKVESDVSIGEPSTFVGFGGFGGPGGFSPFMSRRRGGSHHVIIE